MNGAFLIECVILLKLCIKSLNEKHYKRKKSIQIKILMNDLNVPLEKIKITDTTKIDKIIPIDFLIKEKAKIIILSHIGRPKGKIVKEPL